VTADVWTFGPPEDDSTTYADGTTVPHRHQDVLLNGVKIGYVEIHMHRRRGRDRKTDVSFGITTCVYGPAAGGS
jgi:hypothetical protein